MKKVLLGLLALSAVSMAAAPDLGGTPTSGTNVFQTAQEGAISITGKLTSTVPIVKYVVYAAADGSLSSQKEDTLNLTDYVFSLKESENKFSGTNPKVYVKRISSAGEYNDLETSDIVSFKIKGDATYTSAWVDSWIKAGGTSRWFYHTALMSKSTLDEIVANVNRRENVALSVSLYGEILQPVGVDGNTVTASFMPANKYGEALVLKSSINGEAEIKHAADQATNYGGMAVRVYNSILQELAGGKPLENAKILVKVN